MSRRRGWEERKRGRGEGEGEGEGDVDSEWVERKRQQKSKTKGKKKERKLERERDSKEKECSEKNESPHCSPDALSLYSNNEQGVLLSGACLAYTQCASVFYLFSIYSYSNCCFFFGHNIHRISTTLSRAFLCWIVWYSTSDVELSPSSVHHITTTKQEQQPMLPTRCPGSWLESSFRWNFLTLPFKSCQSYRSVMHSQFVWLLHEPSTHLYPQSIIQLPSV